VASTSSSRAEVLIAGGGFAALEAALALRALAADRVRLTFISPDPILRYRPAATVEAFDGAAQRGYDLPWIARDLGARYQQTRLEAVAAQDRYVRLASGGRLPYDALILAIGARATASVPGALTFRDQRDVPLFRGVLRELEAGQVARPAFVVPSGSSWPLPLYELALLCAAHAEEHDLEAEVSLVTPERAPLHVFGADASRLVADLLDERGVRFVGGSVATGVRRDGSLTLQFNGSLRTDRAVTAPELRARRIPGLPASWSGFVRTDALGRVDGVADVYAAGDMTTFPIKQGGLATQQADRIAHTVAAALGAGVDEPPATQVLTARLLGGTRPLLLRTELDRQGRPATTTLEREETGGLGAPKVFGHYLTPYLEALPPSASAPHAAA
jgi:sulfide:quinone oxidoreductase